MKINLLNNITALILIVLCGSANAIGVPLEKDKLLIATELRKLSLEIGNDRVRYAARHIPSQSEATINTPSNQAIYEKVNAFEKRLDEATKTFGKKATKDLVVTWGHFMHSLQAKPSRENIVNIINLSDDLLYRSDSLVRESTQAYSTPDGELFYTATMQSVLAERISMLYTAYWLGVRENWVVEELSRSIAAYDKGHAYLKSGNTESKGSIIEGIDTQWNYAKATLSHFNRGNLAPLIVSKITRQLSDSAADLSNHYASSIPDNNQTFALIIPE